MAQDNKYGKVTIEHGNIGEDEPVFVCRAQDVLLPEVLAYYAMCCIKAGSPARHINIILESLEKIKRWQILNNPRIPSSLNSKTWMDH